MAIVRVAPERLLHQQCQAVEALALMWSPHISAIMRSARLCRVRGGTLRPAAVFPSISLRIIRLASGRTAKQLCKGAP